MASAIIAFDSNNLQENGPDGAVGIETFFDDNEFSGTKRYTWAVSLLRRFHDLLLKTIESWDLFASTELQFFEVDSRVLSNLWGGYFSSITRDVNELRFMQRSLDQRIQTFDRIKDGVFAFEVKNKGFSLH